MFNKAIIRAVDHNVYTIKGSMVSRYDLEYSPSIVRFDFNDNSFTEFTRRNIISITIEPSEEEIPND